MSEFDPSTAPPWRRRVQDVLVYFGLAHEPGHVEPEPGPEWDRLFLAVLVPVWAAATIDSWWLAVYVALAIPAPLVEFVRWRRRAYDRGHGDSAVALLQVCPVLALALMWLFGSELSPGSALGFVAFVGGFVLFGRFMATRFNTDETPVGDGR